MGGGSYSSVAWKGFSASRKYDDVRTTTEQIYKKRTLDSMLDPKGFKIRESVDGPDNPESTPIIIGLDVTGSMGRVVDYIARKGLKTICEEIYNRKPVTNPHVCVLGIGDMVYDASPFQATQFEADIRIFEELEKVYLEGGGGGNDYESYILAWYFAQYRTKTDSFSKRGRKGFIFTIGDEQITPSISARDIKRHLGGQETKDFTAKELFDEVSQEWNVYHIIIKEGDYASRQFSRVKQSWDNVIGAQRTIALSDHKKIGEVVVSELELLAGKDIDAIVKSWDKETGEAVKAVLRRKFDFGK